MDPWNPFDALGSIYLEDTVELADDTAGLTDGETIWLNPTLTMVGRRCTLAHELVHIERGPLRDLAPEALEREEKKVDRIAAHRLAPTEHVVDAVVWAQGAERLSEIAEETGLDVNFAHIRLSTVTDEERHHINDALEKLGQIP